VACVVVAEDNAELLALFTHVLLRQGHAVLPCRSGQAALELVQREHPDLVLTDFDMPPGMTGMELVAAIKCDPAVQRIPIVMITGSVTEIRPDERSMLAAYLTKPVLPEQLVSQVITVLAGNGHRRGAG
jgi:CheY-like chemotaxis protein